MALQTKQSAELLRPFRQLLLTDAHHGRTVMGHDGHPLLHDSARKAFVAHLAGPAGQQTGDMAFHHRAAVATGTGQLHLVRGALAVQARLIQDPPGFPGGWRGGGGARRSAGCQP